MRGRGIPSTASGPLARAGLALSLVLHLAAAALGGLALARRTAEAGDVLYAYDDVGRLVGAVDEAGRGVAYRYDAAGNLLGVAPGGAGAPAILGLVPASGTPGTAVAIAGTGFSAVVAQNRVAFNGRPAAVTSSSTTRLVVTVPADAVTGPVTVATPAGMARSPASFTVTAPDLAVTAVSAPGAASPRQSISMTWSVSNRGAGTAAAPFRDVVYLSTDALCCAGDSPVAVRETTSPLAPGQGYTRTQTVALPRVPAGAYHLVVVTDDARAVTESDEANNQRATPIAITAADLAPTALTAPARVVAGQTVPVSWTTANLGGGTAYGSWADALYLSASDACCDGARFLGSVTRSGPMGPGATYVASKSFAMPALAPGSYRLFVSVDDLDGVEEAGEEVGEEVGEGNNRRALPLAVTAPDLVPTTFTAPPSLATQQSASISWTVRNEGDGPASATWNDTIYLSPSPVCCSGTVLSRVPRPAALAPGTAYTQTRTVTVPSVPAGSYHLVLAVNDPAAVPEVAADNNHRALPVVVTTPDLVATALTAPASARAGQSVSLGWTVANQGAGPARPPWTDTVYLSADAACCAGDTAIASLSRTAPLAAGGSYAAARSAPIPSRPPGAYYLILKADSAGAVFEADEGNNLRVVPFTIAP